MIDKAEKLEKGWKLARWIKEFIKEHSDDRETTIEFEFNHIFVKL